LLTYYDKAYRNGLAKNQSRIKQTLSWNGLSSEAITSALINM
jgi:hypothetical protein